MDSHANSMRIVSADTKFVFTCCPDVSPFFSSVHTVSYFVPRADDVVYFVRRAKTYGNKTTGNAFREH